MAPGLALLVLVVIVITLLRKIGDIVPGLVFLTVGVLAVFVVPPSLPVGWLIGLIFVVPLLAACAYKAIRGDKRGVTGRRLP
jgi:hypothetical protein